MGLPKHGLVQGARADFENRVIGDEPAGDQAKVPDPQAFRPEPVGTALDVGGLAGGVDRHSERRAAEEDGRGEEQSRSVV